MSEYHSFNVEAATKYGVACALLLEHIGYWVKRNQASGVNRRNGKYWMYKSVKDFSRAYPYLTENQIRRAIEKLRSEELIVSDHFSAGECSRTLWYTLTKNGKKLISGSGVDLAPVPNRIGNDAESDGRECQIDSATMPERLAPVPNRIGNDAVSSIDVLETIVEPIVEPIVENSCCHQEERDINPFGDDNDDDYRPSFDTIFTYASSNLRNLTGGNIERLQSFIDDLPEELIRYAIDKACGLGHPFFGYVQPILQQYVEMGFRTVAEVEAYEAERKKKKGGGKVGFNREPAGESPRRLAGETIV